MAAGAKSPVVRGYARKQTAVEAGRARYFLRTLLIIRLLF